MKLLVIGQSVVDIIKSGEKVEKKPGGIHYSILALNSFAESSDEMYLCSSLSKKHTPLFNKNYDLVNQRFVKIVNEIPTVHLTIKDNSEREEKYTNTSQALDIPEEDLNEFDGIYINMITGYDLTLEQMKHIRLNYNGLIYFDVHTLSRGINKEMERNFRQIPDFNIWAENIDILQANEKEILTMTNHSEELKIVNYILSCGIKIFIITRAGRGVTAYFERNGNINSVSLPAIEVDSISKVGCGDIFGAIFFYNYISRIEVNVSLKLANAASGISTTYSKTEDFINLKSDVLKRLSEE
ncbi:MAG: carbohydrate kinase family protein [Ignavibacteria bacterium]|jgi:sugar/nucleoside kinase (ribokinase family)